MIVEYRYVQADFFAGKSNFQGNSSWEKINLAGKFACKKIKIIKKLPKSGKPIGDFCTIIKK